MDYSANYSELAMYGSGSGLLKPFLKNTDLHHLMLENAEVENTFYNQKLLNKRIPVFA